MATVAVFLALGGGAYALSNDSVKSRHIEDGQVKTDDLHASAVTGGKIDADAVKTGDVPQDELTGEDIDESTLYRSGAATGQNPFGVPIGGLLSSQIRDIGGDGDVVFGGVEGRSVASTDFTEVATGTAFDTVEIGNMEVQLAAPLDAGESRTFTLARAGSFGSGVIETPVTCTIGAGESACVAQLHTQINNPFVAIEVESSGGTLTAADDVWIGAYVKQKADL
jgi:hypothetical protein